MEVLMKWLLQVQCHIASQATGMVVQPTDFGAPLSYLDEFATPKVKTDGKWGDMHGMIDHNSGANAKLCFA
eukprot:CAMPEP_0115849576 /NCGR_PEP_ID=MMETSP0287-20121206/11522_1 /TAXON_ID=412157 /ORGANISM="Chrysochromulina rotalis, Strain UIO044" /LENGTH=70 /DNA_ID=CAMNT_0003303551 /DNA_START=217 /DNA_END=429 /DNA_ORIENTATION=+